MQEEDSGNSKASGEGTPGKDKKANSNGNKKKNNISGGAQSNESSYEPVGGNVGLNRPPTDDQGYLLPREGHAMKPGEKDVHSLGASNTAQDGKSVVKRDPLGNIRSVQSIYEDLQIISRTNERDKSGEDGEAEGNTLYFPLINQGDNEEESIYDEVETMIPGGEMCGAKIIPIEEPPSAYDEVIVNGGRYIIPSSGWDNDSDAPESDFDDDEISTSYFGDHLDKMYENVEERTIASPTPRTISFHDPVEGPVKPLKPGFQQALRGCLPFSRSPKNNDQCNDNSIFYVTNSDGEDAPLYVDANSIGARNPVMPPISMTFSEEEVARYNIVNKILESEATYISRLEQLVQIDEDVRLRGLLEVDKLDVIFASLQDIQQCHEMFNMALAARMNEWTVSDKLGDIICASFSKSTTLMAYTEFVNNFSDAIDMYRAVCKSNVVFAQYLHAKETNAKPKFTFHALMLKPFERFPEFIILIQDLLEVTPVSHPDRVPLQLALTHLECLGETINLRRRETEMKHQVKCLDSQVSQLNKPLASSGRLFLRQDDMVHCCGKSIYLSGIRQSKILKFILLEKNRDTLIDGVSVVGTKKLRLVLLSDMLLCLSPISKKKNIVSGLLNTPKYKYKLKWNVPLLDVQLVEYGAGVSVAAGKYGTVTTYSEEGKYRQATVEIQNHVEDLQHDLAIIGQIAGLASSLRGKHELMDNQKVEQWYKSVENTINEELRAINMFWLEISLPTRSGQQSYVFNLSSPTIKQDWEAATRTAKLALETRNNPGWYLPDDDVTGGLSILRRNMPLLDEFFDMFVFNSKSRVEQTLTYPVLSSVTPTSMTSQGLGHHIWLSARGELQGNVTVLRLDRGSSTPRFVESFKVCSGTVYCMARIPAMNSRPDQTPDKYKTKYGFPFPTIWLGSHSSKIYVFNASSEDRNQPLMEIKLRDAPLVMKFTKKKIYVGLANGTLAIFRASTNDHWNFVQPSILPLGRYPVAIIAEVKDKLWCGSGSQIYVVSKRGDRIQRIIAVDSNMKNLVKHIVSYGVGVWVSVWRKATIKLYHAETCEMMQSVNVVSPVTKMKNDVDSQVQYLAVDKITVTALLVIPGFLWVGTSLGLILLYPIPRLQGVPRVIGRACVAFHGHCGPVRSLFAVSDGSLPHEVSGDDDVMSLSADDDSQENDSREFNLLPDSEDSVESDEEFCFVDDTKPKKKGPTLKLRNFKVSLKKSQKEKQEKEPESEPSYIPDVSKLKVDDFARLMETFSGFPDSDKNVNDETKVKSFQNRLYTTSRSQEDLTNLGVTNAGEDPTPVSNVPGLKTLSDKDTSAGGPPEEKVELTEDSTHDDSETTEVKMPGGVGNEVPVPIPADGTEAGNNLVSAEDTHTSLDSGLVTDESHVEESVEAADGKPACIEKPPRTKIRGVLTPGNVEVPENDAYPSNVEPVYENVAPKLKLDDGQSEYARPEYVPPDNNSPYNVPRQNVPGVGIEGTVSEYGYLPMDNPPSESNGISSEKSRSAQEMYTVILPDDKKQDSLGSASETGVEMLMNQSVKRNPRTMSYVVLSAGEGHVDLRMKLKSKSEIKKDLQTKLLIWRVNNKA